MYAIRSYYVGLLASSAEEYFRGEPAHDVPETEGGSLKISSGSETKFTSGLSKEEIERRIEARKAARASKDFPEADRIRKELDALGIVLEDSKTGTTWKYKT